MVTDLPALSPLATRHVDAAGLGEIRARLDAGERLSFDDGVKLFLTPDLSALAALANRERERRWGDITFFNRNVHVNATNVCEATCIFCSFSRLKTGDAAAYTMSLDEAVGRVKALRGELITEVHIVNGLNPDLPWSYYLDLLRGIKAERPDLHIKAFTAVEIHYFAEKYAMTYHEVLRQLIDAGLGSLPGGGAEIFHPRARKKLCDDKVDAEGWIEVHRVAHELGLRSNCTMLFGSIETIEERVDHMLRLRALQDETGGFQTFIPLRFHHENNRLERLREPTAFDSLRTYAVSRLLLDNIDHIKAYWVMLGVELAQLTLGWGVDDIDGTVREERIYHMAGARTPQTLGRADLVQLIRDAGRVPVERDTLYHVVAEA
ncbi:aminodeoxyfutalosine synthase [Deltaproteobacteria bacterium]|nr:aminodeoxyfutalosine synthase [Deltaproteobacteria bacterium]